MRGPCRSTWEDAAFRHSPASLRSLLRAGRTSRFRRRFESCWPSTVHSHHRAQNQDRKSTRLNSSHPSISYAVFCLKKKKKKLNIFFYTKKKKHNLSTY